MSFSVVCSDGNYGGHHVLRDDCTYALATGFLANPTARPDTACLSGLPGPFADLQRGNKSSVTGPGRMTLDIQTLLRVCHLLMAPFKMKLDAAVAAGTMTAADEADALAAAQAKLAAWVTGPLS